MPIGDKYSDLTRYLENCGKDKISLTVDEIDKIVGGIPKWVYNSERYPWGNNGDSSFYSGWLNAGYVVVNVDDKKQIITFAKN